VFFVRIAGLGPEQAQLARPPRRVGARAAVELAQEVADVHVDRARAHEQLAGDLPVRAAHGQQSHDVKLPAGQAFARELLGLPAAEPAVGLLAELGQARGEAADGRLGLEPASGAVGTDEPLHRLLAAAGGDQRGGGTALGLEPLERRADPLQELDRPLELRRRLVGVAVEERRLAERVGER
jgi:hypothetical protein